MKSFFVQRHPFYLRWNGPIFWFSIEWDGVFSLTVGEKKI